MMKSISIVGAGRVGRALGRCLRQTGWKITVVAALSEASAKRAVRFIGAGRPVAGIPGTLACASVILLTVPDDALVSVALQLAEVAGEELRGKVVLHTSGALDASVLAPLHSCGAAVASMHPMQSFNGLRVPPLDGRVFAIEGDEVAVRAARKIARTLGAVPVGISPVQKPLYHAAGAFAAGLSLAIEEAGVRMLMTAGLKRREAQRSLISLTRQVLDNYEKLGPQKAWTGPLSRGDFGVVAAHERALRDLPEEYREGYRSLSRLSARVLAHDPAAMLTRLELVLGGEKLVAKAKGGWE